ncbi:MAG: hypothetical protein H7840_05960 [Alphaproteobacteria bacterium]
MVLHIVARAMVVFVVLAALAIAGGGWSVAAAQTQQTLTAERQKLIQDYQKAEREYKIKRAEQKIALEELKVQLQRQRLSQSGPPPTPDPADAKYREFVQRQHKEILPLERRYKDLRLRLRENELKFRKLKVDEVRKAPAAPAATR